MQNVYDIFMEKELLFIMPEDKEQPVPAKITSASAVFVHLYYEDSWERFSGYIGNIPSGINVFICSSNPRLLQTIENAPLKNTNVTLLGKENRGRDISALLITFRKIMLRYEYICFIHDKKASFDYLEEDAAVWIRNMWENTLASTGYICQTLALLHEKKEIGLLVPPEPLGKHFNDWYTNGWKKNYENTVGLASELGIDGDLSRDKTPMAIGTVFWGRTDAIKKLLQKEWDYQEFPAEPLPLDGALNHAIERLLPFAAQDAGYDTGVIMSQSYAAWMLLHLKEYMQHTYEFLGEKMLIHFEHQLHTYDELQNTIQRYFQEFEKVYIYGAGAWGSEFLKNLRFWGYDPDGFLVSDGHKNSSIVDGIRVYELSEVPADGKCAVFIAVNYDIQKEIEEMLLQKGLNEYYKLSVF